MILHDENGDIRTCDNCNEDLNSLICGSCRQKHSSILSPNEAVNHPKHYNADPSDIECIEVARHRNFNIGNAFKYLWRQGLKGDSQIEDIEKAIWYLQDEIKRLKNEANL